MTEKQSNFIKRLAAERQLPADSPQTDYVLALVKDEAREPDGAQASRIIDWLLEQPKRPEDRTRAPRESEPWPDVPAGRYALRDIEGAVSNPAFYKVDRPEDGKWAGYTFLSEQSGENRLPIRDAASKRAILTAIAVDPAEAMKLYGQELGHCGRCGRELTDDTSRSFGIGPDCREILGLGRAPSPALSYERRDELVTEALGVAPGETVRIELDEDELDMKAAAAQVAADVKAEIVADAWTGLPKPSPRDADYEARTGSYSLARAAAQGEF
jgi:hypothetical protein